jgi:hypothetical protein
MIEFTILELTLIVLCGCLFVRGMHHRAKARAVCQLVNAMCESDDVFKRVKQARDLMEESNV